jgi:hypothetical protein
MSLGIDTLAQALGVFMATAKARVGAYIPEDLKKEAERIAQRKRRSLSNLIELLLAEMVDKEKESNPGD